MPWAFTPVAAPQTRGDTTLERSIVMHIPHNFSPHAAATRDKAKRDHFSTFAGVGAILAG